MQTVKVMIANREYTIKQLPIKPSRDWRAQFESPIMTVLGTVKEFGLVSKEQFADGKALLSRVGGLLLNNAEDLTKVLLSSSDLILEAVFVYSPELEADRAYIEDNAFDNEVVAVFLKILGMVYPFGSLLQMILSIGRVGE